MTGFVCRTCGEFHGNLPLAFGPDAPASWAEAEPSARSTDSALSSDQCVIGGEFFFVRGCIDVSIHDSTDVFRWLVWVSVSRASFERISELWTTEGREAEPPYFGWLNTRLPGYPDTFNLKVNLHTRPVGDRPYVEVEPTDHPLAIEQRNGLSWVDVYDRVEKLLHPARPSET
jgi:hypothetical protein